MKKYITVILAFTLIVVVAFTTGAMAVTQERIIEQFEQETAALRDHNERLIRTLDTNAVKHEEVLT